MTWVIMPFPIAGYAILIPLCYVRSMPHSFMPLFPSLPTPALLCSALLCFALLCSGCGPLQFVDHIAGLVLGNFVAGISFGWWKWSHNVHHTVCNSIEHDPDIQHLPFLAITDRIFKGGKFFSSYHNKWFTVDKFVSFLVSYQVSAASLAAAVPPLH